MVNNRPILSRTLFIILSLTWGFLLTLCGAITVGAILSYAKVKKLPVTLKKHGYCYYLNVGKSWGGLNLGLFFLTDSRDSISTKWHEHGHAIQNCFWGPLTPFVITIPSALRYHARVNAIARGESNLPKYDSAWFEHDATLTGRKYRKHLKLTNK